VIVEFVVNNKVHSATKVSLFIANYSRELRMGVNIKIIFYFFFSRFLNGTEMKA